MKSVLTSVMFRPYGYYGCDESPYLGYLDVVPLLSSWSYLFSMSYSSGSWQWIQLGNSYRTFEAHNYRDELFLKTAYKFLQRHRTTFSNYRTPSLYI